MVGENPGQVKVVDALPLQILPQIPQLRIALFQQGFPGRAGSIGKFQLLGAQRLGPRQILAGLQKVVILGPGQCRQPGQHCRTALPEPSRCRQGFSFILQPTPGAVLFQGIGRLRLRQFMIPLDNPPFGSFLPIAVHQSEKGRPTQGGVLSGRRPSGLFPAQNPDMSRQQNLRVSQSHPIAPPGGKERK